MPDVLIERAKDAPPREPRPPRDDRGGRGRDRGRAATDGSFGRVWRRAAGCPARRPFGRRPRDRVPTTIGAWKPIA